MRRWDTVTTPPAIENAPSPPADGMRWVPGGAFLMGSDEFYPEERPVHEASVDGFWMDERLVTVREFRRFVKATGYVTVAERPLDPADYPDADPALLVPGSVVFRPTRGPVDLDSGVWWHYVPGACWHRPDGPGSDTYTRGRHPVTHIAYEDAEAYAAWAGKALPTEAEWERAARGGLDGKRFAWGDEETPGGRWPANWWQGEFPWQNLQLDGHLGTSPVGSFPPNRYGLYDMIGNVWEWTCDRFAAHGERPASPCCAPPSREAGRFPSHVIKGGSHLCAPNYCLRYRPAARQAEEIDTSTTHLGLRCIVRP
jgi:formylglycine-generating enzyme